MKVALGILASIIAIPLIALIGVVGINQLTLDDRKAKAASICRSVVPNMPIENISSIPDVSDALSYNEGRTTYYVFPGFMSPSGPYCALVLQSGKVASASIGSDNW